jgi:hypothetical protein
MSNAADIAAHTQRSTNVCPRIHAAVTDPSRKADADERRHCRAAANGALSRLIRELNAFFTEANAEAIPRDQRNDPATGARLFLL